MSTDSKNDVVRSEKSAKMSYRLLGILASVIVGLIAMIVAFASRNPDDGKLFLDILRSIAIGLCAFLYAFGISNIVFFIMQKLQANLLFGMVSLSLATIILLLIAALYLWWLALILFVVLAVVIILVMMVGNREMLTLVADNARPGYKDYKTRQAEKEAQQKEKEEPLPEVKSFKD